MSKATKPLGSKAYGHIAHLPGSRMGPADHKIHEGQARIATEKVRDKHDRVIVQEKLDGSCVAVANVDGKIVALGRAGYPAWSSPFEQHHLFASWVQHNEPRFLGALEDGERLVGEWLAQAHGTRYELEHEPFVAFDIMRAKSRLPFDRFKEKTEGFITPTVVHDAFEACSIVEAIDVVGMFGYHGAVDYVEGAVWRVEREGKVDFLAKYVATDKVDGRYLPELSGEPPVWNWRPS